MAVRWYVSYRLSYAEVSEWLAERGVLVDQTTIHRWAQRFLPLFGEVARKYRHPIGPDWRVDETYARIPPLLASHPSSHRWTWTDRRCVRVADARHGCRRRFFERAIASSGTTPRRVITDKAAAYPPALAAGGAWCG
jgi:transposase-like protein